MSQRLHRVVLYGSSLLMAGVEAGLRDQPGLHVARVDTAVPDTARCLSALRPDVVLLDLTAPRCHEFAFSFLLDHPGVCLIGLDLDSKTATVLSNQRYAALTMNALAQVIHTQLSQERSIPDGTRST